MKRNARLSGLPLIAVLLAQGVIIAGSRMALAQPAEQAGPQVPGAADAGRRADFERRYGFADWRGKASASLELGRFDPRIEVPGAPVVVETDAFEPYFASTGAQSHAHVEVLLWPSVGADKVPDASPLDLRIRIFSTPLEAQTALMDQLSSPLIAMAPIGTEGPAYGERRVEGLGDVCFAWPYANDGYSRVECVSANVWFTLQVSRPLHTTQPDESIAKHVLAFAAAIHTRLLDTDARTRQDAGQHSAKLTLRRATLAGDGKAVVTDPATIDSVTVAPDTLAILALSASSEVRAGAPLFQCATSTAGSVRYVLDVETGKSVPSALAVDGSAKGTHEVLYLSQYADGVFELVKTSIDIR